MNFETKVRSHHQDSMRRHIDVLRIHLKWTQLNFTSVTTSMATLYWTSTQGRSASIADQFPFSQACCGGH